MNILKILLAVIVAIVVLTLVGKVRQHAGGGAAGGRGAAGDNGLSPAGFFLLTREEAQNPRVTIMSAPNCPSDEAQRAQALAATLQAAGIPCELKSQIGFTFTDPDDLARVNQYMANIAHPLVLVRGRAKGNPAAADVIAEYRAGKS